MTALSDALAEAAEGSLRMSSELCHLRISAQCCERDAAIVLIESALRTTAYDQGSVLHEHAYMNPRTLVNYSSRSSSANHL